MKKFKKWFQCLALVVVIVAPLSACNTMEGLGRDTQAAGDALTDSAKDNKSY